MTTAHTPKIEVRDLRLSFDDKKVLRGVDFRVMPRASMVIIGSSGCGKSVLLKCLLGLLSPDCGAVLVDGDDILSHKRRAGRSDRRMGMLFQGSALFDSLRVWENVVFALRSGGGMSRAEGRRLACEKLSLVGLGSETADFYPEELSGGMRKRVGLARAIANDPEILFFDEPTTGLDPINGAMIDRLIVRCVREIGATAVSITHDMQSVQRIADEVAMLHDGRLIWRGSIGSLYSSGDLRVDQFVRGLAEGPLSTIGRRTEGRCR